MSEAPAGLFPKRAKIVVSIMVVVGFAATLANLVIEDDGPFTSSAASAYSGSGIGHKAFRLLLQARGVPVAINRHPFGRGIGDKDLLLVLEPRLRANESKRLEQLLDGKSRVLLALPKRAGIESLRKPAWISDSKLLQEGDVERVAGLLMEAPEIVRVTEAPEWQADFYPVVPAIEAPQLLVTSEIVPMISTEAGVLVGELQVSNETYEGQSGHYLLSDPDLFNNYGLHRGDNAELILELVRRLLPAGGSVYFDESLHGFGEVPSLMALMTEPPFVGVFVLVMLVAALVLWMTLVPFGRPIEGDVADSADEAERASGHQTLIENSARLLVAGGHKRSLIEHYQWSIMDEVSFRTGVTHAAGDRDRNTMGALRHRLNEMSMRRGVSTRLPDLTLARGNLQAHAEACHEWMGRILSGH